MKKINFKQPKYILPLIAFLPLNFLAYELCDMTSSSDQTQQYKDLNLALPESKDVDMLGKASEMERLNVLKGNDVTGIMELEKEHEDTLKEKDVYTQDELRKIQQADDQKKAVQDQLKKLQESLNRSRDKINATPAPQRSRSLPSSNGADEINSYSDEIAKLQERALANHRKLLGIPDPNQSGTDAGKNGQPFTGQPSSQGSQTGEQGGKAIEERTEVVEKVKDGSEKFHTIGDKDAVDAALIKAMIDQKTKVHEGTRLRFKLLDDVEIGGIKLPKGSYLYGSVEGFSQQRVKAKVSNILIGDKFIKVNLSVYDVDGMEGFYVPESAFRDFVRNAGGQAMQTNMQFNNTGSSSINAETVALQALQNIYSSATQAVQQNIRKNRAKIKYNTIVYLINSQN